MGLYGRDHYRGVPESDLPDAMVEIRRQTGVAILKTEKGCFDMVIHFCPWCGARIGKRRDELPRGTDPFN